MRNVVLVTIDSLRADHCGFMGHRRDTTPTLDSMAADGLQFTNAIAPGPSTPESMPAILTGSYPIDGGNGHDSLLADRRERLSRHMGARETLAERFRARGYTTGGFSPNPYTSGYFGFDAGFDTYEDFVGGSRERLYSGVLDGALAGTSLASLFPARVALNWVQREEVFKPWEAFYGDVLRWVREAEQPYFLWVLLMDVHDPYLVPDTYRTQSRWATYHANWRLWRQGHQPPFSSTTHTRLLRAYDDATSYADAFLGRLRTDLARDDPLVAVHADHGEAFGEHGTFGHHQRLYEENIHVPFVVAGGPERTVERPVSLQSVPEMLCALAEGGDLPLPDGPVKTRTLDGDRLALRGRDWKLMRGPDGDTFYDLAADPTEREPREDGTREGDERADATRRLLERWQAARDEQRYVARAAGEVRE